MKKKSKLPIVQLCALTALALSVFLMPIMSGASLRIGSRAPLVCNGILFWGSAAGLAVSAAMIRSKKAENYIFRKAAVLAGKKPLYFALADAAVLAVMIFVGVKNGIGADNVFVSSALLAAGVIYTGINLILFSLLSQIKRKGTKRI